jgi:hypothetical protein
MVSFGYAWVLLGTRGYFFGVQVYFWARAGTLGSGRYLWALAGTSGI